MEVRVFSIPYHLNARRKNNIDPMTQENIE